MRLEALRHYWYPVARSEEVGGAPFGTTLLDEAIVVWRSSAGVHACQDLCIHRGSPLSQGWLDDGCIVCPYHAWTYDGSGRCVRIPSLPPGAPIPAKARVPAYPCTERYGLVWVCLGEPRQPIPPFPEWDAPDWERYFAGAFVWQAHATRMVENFMDLAHLPWVHPGVLGDRAQPQVPPVTVEPYPDGLAFNYQLPAPPGAARLQGTSGVRLRQRLYAPFTIHQSRYWEDNTLILFFTVQPMGLQRSRRYLWAVRRGRFAEPIAAIQEVLDTIREQDRAIVERQRPELLPVDLSAEMHLAGVDAAAVAYRRLLARLGIEAGSPAAGQLAARHQALSTTP